MNKTKEYSIDWRRLLRSLIIGTILGTIVCLVMLLVMAAIITAQDIPTTAVKPMAVVAVALGSLSSGFFAAKIGRKNGLFLGGACGFLLYILILLTDTVWFQCFQGSRWFVNLIILMACGCLGGVLGVNLKKR